MDRQVIGLDFGTDSVRGVLVDAGNGAILEESVAYYRRWGDGRYCCGERSEFRQHPLDYLESMREVVCNLSGRTRPEAVRGIGLDTTGSTPCAVDASGRPLALHEKFADNPDAMFVLWKDHSAEVEAAEINRALAESPVNYACYEGGFYSSEWFWSKLLHILRRDPAVEQAAGSFVEHCDWMAAELTGCRDAGAIRRNRCTAGHKAMWHPDWGGLPPDAFLGGIDPLLAGWRDRLYAESFTAEAPVGVLSAEWAQKLGLTPQTVIAGTLLDAHCGAVGAGIRPGELLKVFGTSSCDMLVAPEVKRCIPGICGQVDGSILPGLTGLEAGQAAFGDVYAWFRKLLEYGGGGVDLAALEAEAAVLPPGGGGVTALDYFNGLRTPFADPAQRGALWGLTIHTTAPMIYRSLLEATLFGTRAIVEHYRGEGVAIDGITAIGGISRKSEFLMQMASDILHMPLKVAAAAQTGALGGAIFAATAAKLHPDVFAAMAVISSKPDRRYEPDVARGLAYDRLYENYRRLGALLAQFPER